MGKGTRCRHCNTPITFSRRIRMWIDAGGKAVCGAAGFFGVHKP